MDDLLYGFLERLTSTSWRYQSNGVWNDRILKFAADSNTYINDQKVGAWGAKGMALYFRVEHQNVASECLVATNISDKRVDWVKVNSGEEVHMLSVD